MLCYCADNMLYKDISDKLRGRTPDLCRVFSE
jgi:hypothetical protein